VSTEQNLRSHGSEPHRQASPLARGTVIFAAIMMVIAGFFQAFNGFVAIVEDNYYVVARHYVFKFDITTWGWIHLIVGLILLAAGLSVMGGFLWARLVGIAAITLSAVVNFFFIPYYPLASILIIAIDILAIWALCVYRRSDAEAR
jgi:hypothetical protein